MDLFRYHDVAIDSFVNAVAVLTPLVLLHTFVALYVLTFLFRFLMSFLGAK